MNSPFYIADAATKGVPLQALPPSAWTYLVGTPDDEPGTISPITAFKKVDWLYRAVDMRAKAVQKMPYALMQGDVDVTKDPQYAPIQTKLSGLLYRTEAALCLYGACYWMKDRNIFGLNVTPRWLLPSSIRLDFDPDTGELIGLTRTVNKAKTIPLKLTDVVYFWTPNLEAEVGPGTAPAKVATMAAGVLYSVNLTTKAFFDRGMIKAVILTVDGNPPPGETEKLQSRWQRAVGGVKNAWSTFVVRSSVKPVVIGDGFKDSVNPQLTDQAREAISTAMGVPYSLMQSTALAGGTADAEQLNFYDQTIIPECDLISETINQMWLAESGLTLTFLPNKLEVFQSKELQKAGAISQVVGRPIMTINEGRERMELPPLDPTELGDVAQNTIHVKPSPDQLGPDTNADQLPKLVPVQTGPKTLDMTRWEKRTLKRLKEGRPLTQPFDSDHISAAEHTRVLLGLRVATSEGDVKALFAKAKRGRITADDMNALLDTKVIAKARAKVQEARQ